MDTTELKNCTTCKHHVGKVSIDDVANECYPCVHKQRALGYYPNWEAASVSWTAEEEEAFVGWQGGKIIFVKPTEQDTMNPLDTQVGGDHYKAMAIQPVEYITKNNLPYCEANVIKYISRWRDKGGKKDLEKAKHYIDLLIELENL